ncbi:MMPL family transporter [Alicyclobacillus sp. ALC3]|uniref:MMPL family transporter n=1 Tax=Alicyclobacillus sp. ALC3 TaxID=2796143 RepID=UPI0023780EA0|nr:MMPL family transporter [Alicyclobacillus sp. ALC3]WDL95686.1 MMPL family transporter [Alicyclobacillus sp. ALC3]
MENSSLFAKWGRIVAGPKTRFITLVLWVIVVAVLSVLAPAVSKEENNAAANLPNNSPSVVAASKLKHAFPTNSGTPALVVWYNKAGLSATDLHDIQLAAKSLDQHPVPGQMSIPPVYNLPPVALKGFESKDGTTFVLPVSFKGSASTTELQSSVTAMEQRISSAVGANPFHDPSVTSSGLHARITGPVGIAVDAQGLFKNADFALLAATTMLVLVLLILLYRSPILAFVPLVAVGFAYGVISPLLGLLAKSGVITVDAQGVSIMTVLLFGAGTDYCLFLVARYRERLYEVKDKFVAIREAVGGAAGAIAMSGLTVVLSLFTLLFARVGSEHRFAVPFSVAIFVMALAGVTLLPALLAILGRASFFPFIPRTEAMWEERRAKRGAKRTQPRKTGEPGRFSRFVGRVVSVRPWTVLTVSVVVLAVLAVFSTQIKTTYNLLSSFPKNMPSRQGYTLLADHFSQGTLAPVQVIMDKGSASAVKSKLKTLPIVASVSAPTESKVSAGVSELQVTLNTDPYSNAAMADIPKIRTAVEQTLSQSGVASPASHVWVAGETATQLDTKLLTSRDTHVVIPIVIAMIAVLLLLYLRSVVAMVYLMATVLLSYFSALGTGWVVLHYLMGATAIQGSIPLYAFVFLVALGEDYNIFMVSRIWQERWRMPLRQAISEGVSRTSGVITSAGLILAGTFAVLSSLPIQILVQFGIITAIGVLLDTFIVRPFVVPAITAILGRVSFWPGATASHR